MERSALREVAFRPPSLSTERVLLRGWEPDDAAAIFAYASDPRVTPHMAWEQHKSIDDARFFLNEIVAPNYRLEQLDYAICLRAEPERPVGGIGVYLRSTHHQTAELGYVLAHEQWGSGLAPEAGRLLIDHVFRSTTIERIYAPIFGENHKSQRAAEKMGMTLDGVMRSSLNFRGARHDEAIYSVLRGDWAQRSGAFA